MFVEETQLSERSLVILQQGADDFLTSGYHRAWARGVRCTKLGQVGKSADGRLSPAGTVSRAHASPALMTLLVKRFTGTVGVYDKDITLYLWVASYFLRYFNLRRSKAAAAASAAVSDPAHAASAASAAAASWSFGFVGTSLELDTIRFIINKVRVDYLAPEGRVRPARVGRARALGAVS